MAQFAGDRVRVGFFVKWLLDTPQYLWLGFGDQPVVRENDQTVGEQIYSGLGEIMDIPPLSSLVNATADKIEITANGVAPNMLALASKEAADVKNKKVMIGIGEFTDQWQLTSQGVFWIWSGYSDFVSIARRSAGNGMVEQAITVSVSTLFTRRRRATFLYWTLEETKRRSPTDLFWERTKLYARGQSKAWPRFRD